MASSLSITAYSHDMNGCQLHDKTWNHKNTTMYNIWHMEAVWDVNTIHKWVHSATDLIPCWKRRVVMVPTFSSLVTLTAIVTITSDTCIYDRRYMYICICIKMQAWQLIPLAVFDAVDEALTCECVFRLVWAFYDYIHHSQNNVTFDRLFVLWGMTASF